MSFACGNLSISKNEWIRNSKIYENMREQMRITDIFKNSFEDIARAVLSYLVR